MNILSKQLDKLSKFLQKSVILKSMRGGMIASLPLVIIGSVFLIIASLPTLVPFIPAYSEEMSNLLMFPYTFLNGMLAVAVALGIGYYHSKTKNVDQLYGGMISVLTFLMVATQMKDGMLDATYLGARGIFAAILIAFTTVFILGVFESKGLTIKLPDSVPPAVSAPFKYMFSGGSCILLFYILNMICQSSFEIVIPGLIGSILAPLFTASDSIWFAMGVIVLINGLWFFGIHGFSCISGILMPLLLQNTALNAELVAQGKEPTHIFTFALLLFAGNLYWFIPIMFMRCKSQQLKAVGKVSIVPALFNISEPIVFGAPLVGNLTLIFPFIGYSVWGSALYYLATQIGFLTPATSYVGNIIPHPIFGYLCTQDWKIFIVFAVHLITSYLIWLPFVKKYDAELLVQETEKELKSEV